MCDIRIWLSRNRRSASNSRLMAGLWRTGRKREIIDTSVLFIFREQECRAPAFTITIHFPRVRDRASSRSLGAIVVVRNEFLGVGRIGRCLTPTHRPAHDEREERRSDQRYGASKITDGALLDIG